MISIGFLVFLLIVNHFYSPTSQECEHVKKDTIFFGYEEDIDEETYKFNNPSTHFSNPQGLGMLVFFGKENKTRTKEAAKVTVTPCPNSKKVIYEKEWTIEEGAVSTGYIPLKPEQWSKGEYSVKFYRNNQLSVQTKITFE